MQMIQFCFLLAVDNYAKNFIFPAKKIFKPNDYFMKKIVFSITDYFFTYQGINFYMPYSNQPKVSIKLFIFREIKR